MRFNSKDYLYYSLVNASAEERNAKVLVEQMGEFSIEPGSIIIDLNNADILKRGIICRDFKFTNAKLNIDHMFIGQSCYGKASGHYGSKDKIDFSFEFNENKDEVTSSNIVVLDNKLLLSDLFVSYSGLTGGFQYYDEETVRHLSKNYGLSPEQIMGMGRREIKTLGFSPDETYYWCDDSLYKTITTSSSSDELKKQLCLTKNRIEPTNWR